MGSLRRNGTRDASASRSRDCCPCSQLATLALLKLGDVDAAWLAADRGVAAAECSGHLLVLGSAGRILTYVFLDAGECEKAQQLGLAAVAALERKPQASASRLSVLGALYLKTAVAAARQGDRSAAIDLLADADRAAGQLDADRNDYWTAFGPTNVAAHTVSVAVELGEPGYALDQAKRVRLSRLSVPERRAHHLLDVAKAHGQCQQDAKAVELVLAAEQLAPEEVRLRPRREHWSPTCFTEHQCSAATCASSLTGSQPRDVAHRTLYVIVCAAPPAREAKTLVDLAQRSGWDVCVIATPAATRFIDSPALQACTQHAVRSEYKQLGEPDVLPSPDAIIVAPATFNTINKWAPASATLSPSDC